LFGILNVASGNISPRTHTSNISIAARRKVSAPLHRPDDKSWHPALAQNGPAKMTIMAPRVCNKTDCGKPLMKLRLNNCSTVTGCYMRVRSYSPKTRLWHFRASGNFGFWRISPNLTKSEWLRNSRWAAAGSQSSRQRRDDGKPPPAWVRRGLPAAAAGWRCCCSWL